MRGMICMPAAAALAAGVMHGAAALAQPTDCHKLQEMLEERKAYVAAVNAATASRSRMTRRETCSLFHEIQRNGVAAMAWIDANHEWCSIPDAFAAGFKDDQAKTVAIEQRACALLVPIPLKIDPLPTVSGG